MATIDRIPPVPAAPPVPSRQTRARSPFEAVRARAATGLLTASALQAERLDLETRASAAGPGAVVICALQDAGALTDADRARYAGLAERCALVALLADAIDPEPAPGVQGVALAGDDVLRGECACAVLGRGHAAALVAADLGDAGPDGESRYWFALTHRRELVVRVVSMLLRRVTAAAQ